MPVRERCHWIVLGSSPSAARDFPLALHAAARAGEMPIVATANAGIELAPVPDYYWISDPVAVAMFIVAARRAVSAGTRVITNPPGYASCPVLREIGAEIVPGADMAHSRGWYRGLYLNARTSGSWLTQFAVNHGARHISLVGMEGYRSSPQRGSVVDYFDGRTGSPRLSRVMETYANIMREIVTASPQTTFELYGDMTYELKGANVRLAQRAGECVEQFG